MKRIARDIWLTIGLFAALVLITVAAAIRQEQKQQEAPPLSSASAAPNGAKALRLWLDSLGYTTIDQVEAQFGPPAGTSLIMMLEPSENITKAEWDTVDAWVKEGGTLVISGDSWAASMGLEHFSFQLLYLGDVKSELTSQTPLFSSPPFQTPASVQTVSAFLTERKDFITHLAVESMPVLVSFNQGHGQVILSATSFPFSNLGLKKTGNPSLVLNIIAAARPGAVWFDEWHHGVRPLQHAVIGPEEWLRYTPTGHALLYTAALIFLALLMRGRNFGRPIPLPSETARRAPVEYITAIANLYRRAGHRDAVLRQYHHWLKRELGRRYRLSPTLADDQYVSELIRLRPNLDAAALSDLLRRLRRPGASEGEMVQLAREAAEWIKDS